MTGTFCPTSYVEVKIINSSFLFIFSYEWNHREEKSLQHTCLVCYIMVFGSQDLGKRRGEENTLLGIKLGASVLASWP